MVYKPKYNKGLQQQNFKEILQEMVGIESWNLLKGVVSANRRNFRERTFLI